MNWEQAGGRLEELKGRAKATWGQLTGGVGRLVGGKGEEFAGGVRGRYGDARDQARRTLDGPASRAFPARDSSPALAAKGLALVGVGAGLMYYLDPERGRRRRALVRDQLVHALHELDDAIGVASRDVRNRVRGLWAETRSLPARLMGEKVPDEVLQARVRSKMGRYVSHPSAIEVWARGGRVTLRGPILSDEVDDLLEAVASVPGVTGVENRLEVHGQPDDVPELQGGRRRTGARPELLQANWSPTARLLVGTAGGALLLAGARRRGAAQLALGVLGAGLLARAVTNIPARCLLNAGGSTDGRARRAGRRGGGRQQAPRAGAPREGRMTSHSRTMRSQAMQLKEIMTPNVECVRPDDTLQEAARKMRDLDVGPLPVCGDNDRLAGMITDRDIAVRAVAEGKDPKATRVREAMTEEVVYVFEDQDVQEAARTMQERQVRRLVVLNRDKRLVGIVSLGDLATETGDKRKSGEVLQDVSEPSTPRR